MIIPPQFDTPSLIKIEENKTEFSFNISSGIENSRIITFFNDLETYFGFVFIGEVEFSNFSQSRDNLTFNIDIGDLLSIYTINFFDKKTKANLKYNFSFFIPLVEYLKNQGKRVEVMAFGKSTSSKLKEVADEFIDMDEQVGKFLFKK
jgi:hypothetical protein